MCLDFSSQTIYINNFPLLLCACVSSSSLLQVYEGITFYNVHQFCDVVVISKCNIMIVLKISYVTQFRQGGDSTSKIENKFQERFGELNVS